MEARAYLKFLRISPRKVKIVCDLIRGQDVSTARAYLLHTPKAASEPVLKLLNSAVANAEHEHHVRPESLVVKACYVDKDKLYVSTALADPGPTLKRGMPRAKGSYNRILKRTTHLTIGVSERD